MKYKCSKCSNVFDGQPNFCPTCGAKLHWNSQKTVNKSTAKSEPKTKKEDLLDKLYLAKEVY